MEKTIPLAWLMGEIFKQAHSLGYSIDGEKWKEIVMEKPPHVSRSGFDTIQHNIWERMVKTWDEENKKNTYRTQKEVTEAQ